MAKTKPYKSLNVRLDSKLSDWFEDYCKQVGWSKTTGVERMMIYYKNNHISSKVFDTDLITINEEK